MIDKKNYPISVLEDISLLFKKFYEFESQYSDLLIFSINKDHLIEIKDKQNPTFRFVVSTPSQDDKRKTTFKATISPWQKTSNKEHVFATSYSEILTFFKSWIDLVTQFHSIDFSKEDIFSKQSEEEFFAEFEIIESDAALKALSFESQLKVYNLLEQLQNRLENNKDTNPQVQEIIEDAEILKSNLQNLSQTQTAKGIAKIQAKIKKLGLKFFKDVVDVAYKEAIKFALRGGVEGIINLLP